MRTVACISFKGGVGKTTLLCNVAAIAVNAGEVVWLIDMDPQDSATRWVEERERHAKLAQVHVARAWGSTPAQTSRAFLRALADAHRAGATLVLIDTPQGSGAEHFEAIAGAHVVLIPSKPHFFDANSILRTLRRCAEEQRPAYVLFTDVERGKVGAEMVANACDALASHGARFAPLEIHHSVEYPHAAAEGKGVTETAAPRSPIAAEMKALARWIDGQAKETRATLRAASPTFRERVARSAPTKGTKQ